MTLPENRYVNTNTRKFKHALYSYYITRLKHISTHTGIISGPFSNANLSVTWTWRYFGGGQPRCCLVTIRSYFCILWFVAFENVYVSHRLCWTHLMVNYEKYYWFVFDRDENFSLNRYNGIYIICVINCVALY